MQYTFDDVAVETINDRVFWMSDWLRASELIAKGYLVPFDCGPGTYGHTELYITHQD